jgi:hypothetical protein
MEKKERKKERWGLGWGAGGPSSLCRQLSLSSCFERIHVSCDPSSTLSVGRSQFTGSIRVGYLRLMLQRNGQRRHLDGEPDSSITRAVISYTPVLDQTLDPPRVFQSIALSTNTDVLPILTPVSGRAPCALDALSESK